MILKHFLAFYFFLSMVCFAGMGDVSTGVDRDITKAEIIQAQKDWASGVVRIGELKDDPTKLKDFTSDFIDRQYAYDYQDGIVIFKPTKALDSSFRSTKEGALAYFIGGSSKFPQDTGFALQPWTNIKFNNKIFYYHGNIAIVAGDYDFTSSTGETVTVDYTFGYVLTPDNELKIFLHHSSLPFTK